MKKNIDGAFLFRNGFVKRKIKKKIY